jgi:nucleotide-binding universal stress UspA family protein
MVSINRILCPIDFSEFSRDAVRHGVALARWYAAHLILFHVYQTAQPLPVDGAPGTVPVLVEVDPDTVADDVRRFCTPLLGACADTAEIVVRSGDAAREIRDEAARGPYDLLILGTHGRSGFERLFLGSVTEKVIRSTRTPVLTIPPPVREPGSPLYKTILCPVEFSDAAIRALEYALSLAKEADARLILMHVVEDFIGHGGALAHGHLSVSEYYARLEEDAAMRLRSLVPDDARTWSRPEARVVRGHAYQEILEVVTAEQVDLVVMGVQGKSVVNRLVFGSTTHRVIREAGCPVLTLHAGGDDVR